jgi:membrane protein YdbS with pleckstrin-like domain
MLESQFTNTNMQIDQLPTIISLVTEPLSEQYAPINRLIHLSLTLIICTVGLTLYLQPFIELPSDLLTVIPYVIWTVAILGFLITWFTHARDLAKSYALKELDLHYSSGLFFRKVVSQPITRIQHIELKRGPIERKVGLATLQVFSAGGEMHTFQIPGLPVEIALQIRQFILQHKDVVKHG